MTRLMELVGLALLVVGVALAGVAAPIPAIVCAWVGCALYVASLLRSRR